MKKELFKFNFRPDDLLLPTPEVLDFAGCCGAKILTGFCEDRKSYIISLIKDQINDDLNDHFYNGQHSYKIPNKFRYPTSDRILEKFLQSTIDSWMPDFKNGTLYFVILNIVQSWIGPYLKKHGFRLVSDRTVNANSGNRLYVWLRDPKT